MPPRVRYRLAGPDDAERTFAIVRAATDDLLVRAGRTPSTGDGLPLARVIRFRHACLRHDPERFWLAEAGGEAVGAAIAVLRETTWYLAALHVLPEHQGLGIGSELVRRALGDIGPDTTRVVLTDALNPGSNGLYLRLGMLPLESTLTFDGPAMPARTPGPARRARPPLSARPIDPVADEAALAGLDRSTVGFARPTDHAFWSGVPGLHARLLHADGQASGYLYVSEAGDIGPVAVAGAADLPAALDLAAAIAREHDAEHLHLRAFGSSHLAVGWALEAGLRLSGIGLMLGSRRVGRFEGYVTSGADALY